MFKNPLRKRLNNKIEEYEAKILRNRSSLEALEDNYGDNSEDLQIFKDEVRSREEYIDSLKQIVRNIDVSDISNNITALDQLIQDNKLSNDIESHRRIVTRNIELARQNIPVSTTAIAATYDINGNLIGKGVGLEEGHKAIIKEIKDLKKILVNHIKTGNTPVSHMVGGMMGGEGVVSSITNLGKKAYRKTKETASSAFEKASKTTNKVASTAKDVATKVITGNTGMPPNVKSMLDKYGNSIISDMTIARNPVGSALVSALSVASMGEFKKNLDNSPYDKLFHLKLIITLQNGIKLALEKVERVSLTKYTKPVKGQEDESVSVDKQITLGQLYHNAEMVMGDRFYPYSARDNNCQNFILSVLKASGIGGERDYAFIKQDTKSLFGDDSFVRKLSNTVTDIGARFNVLLQGGKIKKGRGRKVFPPDHVDKDFISLPNYLQSDALAGNIVLGDNTPDDDGESGTGAGGAIDKGAFRKSFYQRQAKYKHIKSLDAYARYIVSHPKDFSMKVRRRAQFLINVH